MENYEEKYKAALGWMQSLYDGLHGKTREEAEHYFPELKESEDERIKKAIIATIHLYYGEPLEYEAKDMLAWLEKQGEPTEINPSEFDLRLNRLLKQFETLPEELVSSLNFYLNVVQNDGTYKEEEQGEQNHDWGEEDERNLEFVISQLRIIIDEKHFAPVINWLKSLKDRCAWKPTTEQLRELHCVISGCSFETSILVELEENLKKLL